MPNDLLPKRVAKYIQDVGVRSLDHLAAHFEAPAPAATPEGENAPAVPASAIQTLVENWKAMAPADKESFVERVAASVREIVVATATLPVGLKAGKKTARAASKIIRKQVKEARRAASPSRKHEARKKKKDQAKRESEAATTGSKANAAGKNEAGKSAPKKSMPRKSMPRKKKTTTNVARKK